MTLNLIGMSPSPGPVTASLTLGNTSFLPGGGQILQSFGGDGRTVTPSVTVDASAQTVSLTFPPQAAQVIATIGVALPGSGTTVTGTVTLPPGYQLQIQSEEGTTTVRDSGPVSFPAPPAP